MQRHSLINTASTMRRLPAAPLGMAGAGHRFHQSYCALLLQLAALPELPGVLGEEDRARVAAQLLLETWLSGIEQVDGVGLRRRQVLLAWADGRSGRFVVHLSLRQALAYSVEETSRALEEALQAWPLDAAQRRRLHALPPSW